MPASTIPARATVGVAADTVSTAVGTSSARAVVMKAGVTPVTIRPVRTARTHAGLNFVMCLSQNTVARPSGAPRGASPVRLGAPFLPRAPVAVGGPRSRVPVRQGQVFGTLVRIWADLP